jgi:hypothetical protein
VIEKPKRVYTVDATVQFRPMRLFLAPLLRGCYEPPIKLSSLGSKRQMKAAKCRPINVAGSRS